MSGPHQMNMSGPHQMNMSGLHQMNMSGLHDPAMGGRVRAAIDTRPACPEHSRRERGRREESASRTPSVLPRRDSSLPPVAQNDIVAKSGCSTTLVVHRTLMSARVCQTICPCLPGICKTMAITDTSTNFRRRRLATERGSKRNSLPDIFSESSVFGSRIARISEFHE